jgi:hypothetical protein
MALRQVRKFLASLEQKEEFTADAMLNCTKALFYLVARGGGWCPFAR